MSDDGQSNGGNETGDDDGDVEALLLDEVIGTTEVGEPGKFALVLRSGEGFIGLVFTPDLAREAAAALLAEADEEGA